MSDDRLEKSEKFSIKEVIKYSNDSIVSKTLIDSKSGSLTIFSFDSGQKLSEHTAPYDAFLQVTEGEALISIADNKYTVTEGEAIILPANIPHSVTANKKFKMLLCMIRGEES